MNQHQQRTARWAAGIGATALLLVPTACGSTSDGTAVGAGPAPGSEAAVTTTTAGERTPDPGVVGLPGDKVDETKDGHDHVEEDEPALSADALAERAAKLDAEPNTAARLSEDGREVIVVTYRPVAGELSEEQEDRLLDAKEAELAKARSGATGEGSGT